MYRPRPGKKKITPFYFTGRPGPGSRPSRPLDDKIPAPARRMDRV